jgi:hypothetical protein
VRRQRRHGGVQVGVNVMNPQHFHNVCYGVYVGGRKLTANLRLCTENRRAGISCACIRYRIGRYGCKVKSLPAIVLVSGLRPRMPVT